MPSDGSNVPAGEQNSWSQFLKSLTSFGGDLSALTAPSFILSPTSLLEFSGYWGEHPDVLASITEPGEPLERMINTTRFYVSTLKGAYTARNQEQGSEKKPLNPILGEVFKGKWPDEASQGRGETVLIAEQVSHHPPVSAYHLENEKAQVLVEGHNGQSTHFSKGTITVKQVGHAMVHTKPPGKDMEVYLITLPELKVEGILYGKPYIELSNTVTHISSSSGYLATLEFSGKGWVSGKPHQLKITFAPIKEPQNVLYTVQGDWTGQLYYVGASPSGTSNELFYDAEKSTRQPILVKDISEQAENESRRLWRDTAQGIITSNFDLANKSKSQIEQEQREKRKLEAEGKLPPHQNQLFTRIEDDPEYAVLAAYAGHQPEHQDTFRRKISTKGTEAV